MIEVPKSKYPSFKANLKATIQPIIPQIMISPSKLRPTYHITEQ